MNWSERSIVQTFVFGKTNHLFDSYSFLGFCFVPIAQLLMRIINLEMESFMEVLKDRLMTIYVPKEGVAIDESVMKCRGHLSLCSFQSIQSARS